MRVWLRELRLKQLLTEAEVSQKAGITQPFYHNIENGTKNPSVQTAKALGTVLGFEWTRLFEEKKDA